MSTGTKIVQNALKQLGVYSPLMPTNPESLVDVKDKLNSMIARWYDDNIRFGAVPLNAIGDELSEPAGLTNTIEFNLALECVSLFPNAQISAELRSSAKSNYLDMRAKYQDIDIPKKVGRSTLPKGQGNIRSGIWRDTFFDNGEEIG